MVVRLTTRVYLNLDLLEKEMGNPLQYSCLESSMDGGAWWATVNGVAKSRTPLSDFTFTFLGESFSFSSRCLLSVF